MIEESKKVQGKTKCMLVCLSHFFKISFGIIDVLLVENKHVYLKDKMDCVVLTFALPVLWEKVGGGAVATPLQVS